MAIEGGLIGIGIGVLKLVLGLVLAIASIYIGLSMFGRLTKGINEEEELKKGNVAVSLLLVAIILSLANVIQSGVSGMTDSITQSTLAEPSKLIGPLVGGIIQVLIGLLFAVVSIYIALNILDKITKGIDEMAELKKGNVAVAVIMAGVIYAVSFVVQAGVSGIGRPIAETITAIL